MTTAIETPPEIQAAADAVVEANDEKMKAMPFIERIWLMRQELGMLPKLGENRPQGYNYLQESDVTVAVRKLEKRFRIMFVLGQDTTRTHIDATLKSKSGNPMTGVSVVQRYDVINVDNPTETLSGILGWKELSSEGYSADTGDKALYKARTGAKKYALTDTFLIASGDDPERAGLADDAQTPRAQAPRGADDLGRATEGQIKAFKNRSRGVRATDVIKALENAVGVQQLGIPPGDVPEFIKTMSAKQMNLALAELNKLPRKPRANSETRGTRTITNGPENAPPPPRTPSASAGRVPDDSSAEQR